MSLFNSIPSSQPIVTLSGVTSPDTAEVILGLAGVETAVALPANCRRYELRWVPVGPLAILEVGFSPADPAPWVVYPGTVYAEEGLSVGSLTLYIAANRDAQTVLIKYWT